MHAQRVAAGGRAASRMALAWESLEKLRLEYVAENPKLGVLRLGEHMLSWSEMDVRAFLESGGIASPSSASCAANGVAAATGVPVAWRSCPCGSYAPVGTKPAGSSVRASPLLALRGRAACESPDNTMRSRDEKVPLQPDRSV